MTHTKAVESLTSFINDVRLQGRAYSNAKEYASGPLTTLIKGSQLYIEAVKSETQKISEKYASEVGEDLNEDQLLELIHLKEESQRLTLKYLNMIDGMDSSANNQRASLNQKFNEIQSDLTKLREKLQKLRDFSSSSRSVRSNIAEMETALTLGYQQVQMDIQVFQSSGQFPIYEMQSWEKTLQSESNKIGILSHKNPNWHISDRKLFLTPCQPKKAPLNNTAPLSISSEFKKNLMDQYGFDSDTSEIIYKLYNNLQIISPFDADYQFNRIIGGVVYDDVSTRGGVKSFFKGLAGSLMWSSTAGNSLQPNVLLVRSLRCDEIEKLYNAVAMQHVDDGKHNDFAHQSITMATILHPFKEDRSANLIAFVNKKTFNPVFVDDLSGWEGDVTGKAIFPPSIGKSDFKSDLDSVNIVGRMKEKKVDYLTASTQYYRGLTNREFTRAMEFDKYRGISSVVDEILDVEKVRTLNDLKEKNISAYNFIYSLLDNQPKGQNFSDGNNYYDYTK